MEGLIVFYLLSCMLAGVLSLLTIMPLLHVIEMKSQYKFVITMILVLIVAFFICLEITKDHRSYCNLQGMKLSDIQYYGSKFECKNKTESKVIDGFPDEVCFERCVEHNKWGNCVNYKDYDCKTVLT